MLIIVHIIRFSRPQQFHVSIAMFHRRQKSLLVWNPPSLIPSPWKRPVMHCLTCIPNGVVICSAMRCIDCKRPWMPPPHFTLIKATMNKHRTNQVLYHPIINFHGTMSSYSRCNLEGLEISSARPPSPPIPMLYS